MTVQASFQIAPSLHTWETKHNIACLVDLGLPAFVRESASNVCEDKRGDLCHLEKQGIASLRSGVLVTLCNQRGFDLCTDSVMSKSN